MTKQEVLDKIKELEDYVKELDDESVGFSTDEIFLLSKDEYRKYKYDIPQVDAPSWLRTPAKYSDTITYASSRGIDQNGAVYNSTLAIRPVIKIDKNAEQILVQTSSSSVFMRGVQVGDRIVRNKFPWICIDAKNYLFIAEVPIAFDKFDSGSTDYKNSNVRKFLLKWIEER